MPRKPDLSLIGQTYNNLKVDKLTDRRNSYGRRLYSCTCLLCVKERLATKQNLQKGEIKDCGGHWAHNDITNKLFGDLTAKYPILGKKQGKNRCMVWRCECSCGKSVDVPYDSLVSKNTTSCGHIKADKIKDIYMDGTAPCKISVRTIRSANSSGVTGVYYDKARSKWCAEVMFKRKKYFLGRYYHFGDAVCARKKAAGILRGPFLEWYAEAYPEQCAKLRASKSKQNSSNSDPK